MKRTITLLATGIILGCLPASAQYTYTTSHTAEELLAELAGDGLTILNPVLTCRDSFNAIYTGTGGLDFDNGIALSTGKLHKIFSEFTGTPPLLDSEDELYVPVTANDRPMNDMIDRYGYTYGEAFSTCSIDLDIIPQAKTLEMDFIFASSNVGGAFACEPYTDYIAVLISGGTEFSDTINLTTYPGTDVPVSTWTMMADSAMVVDVKSSSYPCDYIVGEEIIPLDEYTIDNNSGLYLLNYELFTIEIPISTNVSPCDTYHLKIAISDGRYIGDSAHTASSFSPYASTFFLKSGSLRTTGQPEDCPTTVDPEPPSSLSEYLKQQAQIKVSPNPFNTGMAIAIQDDNGKDIYSVDLYDIGGRLLSQTKGNLNEVNTNLSAVGKDLTTGMYMLKIQSASGKYNHTVKVVKK
jgi:hypothetical protein